MRHHDLQRAREREDDVDDVEDAEAEEQAHLREVAGGAAHDLAGRHRPVERGAEPVQPVEEQRAQLVLDVAAGVEDEPAARDARDEGDEREAEDERAPGASPLRDRPPKMRSIAAFDSQSMRFIASWNAAEDDACRGRRPGIWRRNWPPSVTGISEGSRCARRSSDVPASRSVVRQREKGDARAAGRADARRTGSGVGRRHAAFGASSPARDDPSPRRGDRDPSTSSRVARRPSMTRAAPLPSSSWTTPTFPRTARRAPGRASPFRSGRVGIDLGHRRGLRRCARWHAAGARGRLRPTRPSAGVGVGGARRSTRPPRMRRRAPVGRRVALARGALALDDAPSPRARSRFARLRRAGPRALLAPRGPATRARRASATSCPRTTRSLSGAQAMSL